MARFYRFFLLIETVRHIDAVGDTMTIGDDQRWTIKCFCLSKRFDRLIGTGSHGYTGDIGECSR